MSTRNRRGARQSSNIFQMISKEQITELREAFNILDGNNDGILSRDDLVAFLSTIGNPYTEEEIDEMMREYDTNISFVSFITLIGEKLSKLDDEKSIIKALREFSSSSNEVDENLLSKWLGKGNNALTENEINLFFKDSRINGKVDINRLAMLMKHGEVIIKQEE